MPPSWLLLPGFSVSSGSPSTASGVEGVSRPSAALSLSYLLTIWPPSQVRNCFPRVCFSGRGTATALSLFLQNPAWHSTVKLVNYLWMKDRHLS